MDVVVAREEASAPTDSLSPQEEAAAQRAGEVNSLGAPGRKEEPALPSVPATALSREDLAVGAPARKELVQEVAQVVCKRADDIAENLVTVFTEKGKETMKVWHREQAAQVEAIKGQLHVCTESYAKLRQENAALRTSLEAIVRHIQMVSWASPMVPWANPGVGMPFPMQQHPAAAASAAAARQDMGAARSPFAGFPPRQDTSAAGGRGGKGCKQAASTRALFEGVERKAARPSGKAAAAPTLPPTIEEGGEDIEEDEVEEELLPPPSEAPAEASETSEGLDNRLADSSPTLQVSPPCDEDAEAEAVEAELDAETLVSEPERQLRQALLAPLAGVETPPIAQDDDAPAPSTPPRRGADLTTPVRIEGVAPPPGLSLASTPVSQNALSPKVVTSDITASGLKSQYGGSKASTATGTPSTEYATPSRAPREVESPSTASPATSSRWSTTPIRMSLRRMPGMPLGLEVRPDDMLNCLHVDRIHPGTIADAWNRACGDDKSRELRPGDRVISVNGATAPKDMRSECERQLCIRLEVIRDDSEEH
eukprot:TRINITY_DN26534_c0_g1_i1.p1 TRINITY_DN26534_c0_g1~~TRINITY_DN26534_c0_g1_i1.p1  ORF type:complete len:540 (-),score=141.47 TRINITY_DN26534_c0_g1_i1:207-1826(-)